ncbi:hypothetical protein V9T40_010622 [Parthenolecanium corni]|uniref:Uncharacterized protein n=1 Tax=Parthenolecanium corni TaxID=536013 RepID=A0AAN9XXC9_9HEMI
MAVAAAEGHSQRLQSPPVAARSDSRSVVGGGGGGDTAQPKWPSQSAHNGNDRRRCSSRARRRLTAERRPSQRPPAECTPDANCNAISQRQFYIFRSSDYRVKIFGPSRGRLLRGMFSRPVDVDPFTPTPTASTTIETTTLTPTPIPAAISTPQPFRSNRSAFNIRDFFVSRCSENRATKPSTPPNWPMVYLGFYIQIHRPLLFESEMFE